MTKFKITDYHDFVDINTSKEERRKLNIGDIWSNSIKCLSCGDEVRSKNKHHMAFCSCKKVAIDGGSWYSKVSCEDSKLLESTTVMFKEI